MLDGSGWPQKKKIDADVTQKLPNSEVGSIIYLYKYLLRGCQRAICNMAKPTLCCNFQYKNEFTGYQTLSQKYHHVGFYNCIIFI